MFLLIGNERAAFVPSGTTFFSFFTVKVKIFRRFENSPLSLVKLSHVLSIDKGGLWLMGTLIAKHWIS